MAVIEPVTEERIPELAELASRIWHSYFPAMLGTEQVDYMVEKFQSAGAISSQLAEGYEYALAVEYGQPLGYCGMVKEGDELFLSKLYLESRARGKGVGRLLFEYAEERARCLGCCAIRLTVHKGNDLAINFYRKAGMVQSGEFVKDIGRGFKMDDYVFRKELK